MSEVEDYLHSKGLQTRPGTGSNVRLPCFFHGEDAGKRGRLYVNVGVDEKTAGLYLCHVCGVRGNFVTLKRHFGDEVERDIDVASQHTAILEMAANFYASVRDSMATEYLVKERGLTPETIERHQIGFAPGGRALLQLLRGTFGIQEILATGMVVERGGKHQDFLQEQVTIPYHVNGMVVAIRGKEIGGKYVTPPGTKARVFNVDSANRAKELVITEGEFDALVLEQLGFPSLGVPGAGTFQPGWVDYFTDTRRVYILFDPDAAGRAGTERVLQAIGTKGKAIDLPIPEGAEPKEVDPSYLVVQQNWGKDEFLALFNQAAKAGSLLISVREAYEEHQLLASTSGLQLGYEVLDQALEPGLLPGQVAIPLAKTNSGKEISTSQAVPTPTGYRKAGDLQPGDHVFGVDGLATLVTGVFPQGMKPLYRMTFSDGSYLDSGLDHLWEVQHRCGRHHREWESVVMTTKEIMDSGLQGKGREWKYQIPMTEPVQYPTRTDYRTDPYTLGTLIANGDTPDLDKFIPEEYLLGSVQQRIALLRGLMDGDGSASRATPDAVRTCSPRLAEDVVELVASLGGTGTVGLSQRHDGKPDERLVSIVLPAGVLPFSTFRKARVTKPRARHNRVPRRAIVSIDYIEDDECVCIAVDHPRALYLAGRTYVATHNTLLLLNIMHRAARSQKSLKFLFVSLEQTRSEWFDRARRLWFFDNPCDPALNADTWDEIGEKGQAALHQWINDGTQAFWQDRLYLIDNNRVSEDALNGALAEYKELTGAVPDLVCVDYLGYWAAAFSGNNRYEKVTNAVMGLKAIAKEWRVPIISPHQVSRMAEFGTEFSIDQGRDSGAVEETADFVFQLWNLDDTKGNKDRVGKMMLKVGKSRHGGKGRLVNLQFGYLSLVVVPEEDHFCYRAEREAKWERSGVVPWDQAIYYHHLGLEPDLSKFEKKPKSKTPASFLPNPRRGAKQGPQLVD